MATLLYMVKLYDSLKALDKASLEVMEQIPANKKVLVEIKELSKKDLRSTFQNRLYWRWLTDASETQINEQAGKTKDEWHIELKRKFLMPIFERDDAGYAAMLVTMRKLYKSGFKGESEELIKFIVDKTSTTDASIKQFTEYLNDIERHLHSLGISLRTDPEIYRTAMGIKD